MQHAPINTLTSSTTYNNIVRTRTRSAMEHSASEDPTRPELNDLAEDLHDVKTKWKTIGTQLKLPRATLQRIEAKYKDNPEEAFTETMDEWLRMKTEPKQSWSDIVKVLRTRSVGESRLATSVKRIRCPVPLEQNHDPGSYIFL